jgi:hypothetical protein
MINITVHKLNGNLTDISASYYPLPLMNEFASATLELPSYPPIEEVDLFALVDQLKIIDGVLASDTLNIVSQQINSNYVEPTLEADTSQTQSQLENM